MNKKYIKVLYLLFFVVLLTPKIALAVWWNPTSWFNNWSFLSKKGSQTELLEKRIQELENQIQEKNSLPKTIDLPIAENAEPQVKEEKIPVNKNTTQTNTPTKNTTSIDSNINQPQTTTPVAQQQMSDFEFEVTRVTQSIFEETSTTYAYSGYEITVKLTANKDDIYIPMTTTDSTNGLTGFIYSVVGDHFRGDQESKVSCSKRNDNLCKIAKGESNEITTTVWLFPELSGTYGVMFDKMKVGVGSGGEFKTYNIGETTESIHISI